VHVVETEFVAINVRWQDPGDLSVTPANQFLVQIGIPDASGHPDGVYLTVGQLTPPFVAAATFEEATAQLEALSGEVQVKAHQRYLISRARVQELIDVLTAAAKAYDDAGGTS
jgi:hypothetical protein